MSVIFAKSTIFLMNTFHLSDFLIKIGCEKNKHDLQKCTQIALFKIMTCFGQFIYLCSMKQRIIGFDIARAYAIFGMFIVNFNFCFGTLGAKEGFGAFLNLFVGNSTSIFIILAGMGLAFMTNRTEYSLEEKKKLKSIVLKRSWFFFALGVLLYSWWPGDILHFYGAYMHLAAFMLFVPKRYYLWVAGVAIVIFHVLLFVIPIETSWDFDTTKYADFWTIKGFLRNSLYNGWNAFFPWVGYFMLGMWLGRLNWYDKKVQKKVFFTGLFFFVLFEIIRIFARNGFFSEATTQYIMSEYFPPYLPFMAITASFALMVISFCMFIGEKYPLHKLLNYLALTGKMTLTHYVMHLSVGVILLSQISGLTYTGYWRRESAMSAISVFSFAFIFFIFCVIFSVLWSKYFKNGPIESILRKISG